MLLHAMTISSKDFDWRGCSEYGGQGLVGRKKKSGLDMHRTKALRRGGTAASLSAKRVYLRHPVPNCRSVAKLHQRRPAPQCPN